MVGTGFTGLAGAGFAVSLDGAGCGHDSKAAVGSLEIDHAAARKQMNAGRVGTSNERVQDVPCAPTDWKQLAVSFLLERHIELAEELALLTAELFAMNAEPDDAALETALERGLKDVEAGRVRPVEEVKAMIPRWTSKS